MSFEIQGRGAAQRETTEGESSTRVGIPTVNVATNQVALYYDMEPPSFWRRLLVFLRGLIFGLTFWFGCPAVKLTSDDLTWGLRLSVVGRMLGGAITGGAIGVGSTYLGCWLGSGIATSLGDEDDDRTGCRVGAWSCLALGLCFMIFAIVRQVPKSVFRSPFSAAKNQKDALAEPSENK